MLLIIAPGFSRAVHYTAIQKINMVGALWWQIMSNLSLAKAFGVQTKGLECQWAPPLPVVERWGGSQIGAVDYTHVQSTIRVRSYDY